MLTAISTTLRWFYSVGTKFLRVVPGYTVLIIISTLLSQLALLLAFFLPLKVIILLGSATVPRYFPDFFLDIDRDVLIIGLSVAAASFYLIFLLAEKFISFCTRRATNKLLAKSYKILLFENQEDVAAKGYQRYARCVAGGVFVCLVLLLLLFVYSDILILITVYLVSVIIILTALNRVSQSVSVKISGELGGVMTSLAAVGFLLCFGFIVLQFLLGSSVSLLVAVIALLLSRQTFNRIAAFVSDLSILYSQRLKLNALFFHGQVFLKDESGQAKNFWSLIAHDAREVLIRNVLQELLGVKPDKVEILWHQSGVPDVAAFVVTSYIGSHQPDSYLVKIFNRTRGAIAIHEATLLTDIIDGSLPSLELLAVGKVDSLHCHVFVMPELRKLPVRQVKPKSWLIMVSLAEIPLSAELTARYGRSKPYLWQRLNVEIAERLCLAVLDDKSLNVVLDFEQRLSDIQTLLQALPLVILNPDLSIDTIFLKQDDSLIVTHWGRWSLEPLGSGWPVQEKQLKLLAQSLSTESQRKELENVVYEHLKLAAFMYAFERAYLKQQYVTAIEMLPDILSCVNPPENP